jgi:hypothetical protein
MADVESPASQRRARRLSSNHGGLAGDGHGVAAQVSTTQLGPRHEKSLHYVLYYSFRKSH